jgi:hypothetical protein
VINAPALDGRGKIKSPCGAQSSLIFLRHGFPACRFPPQTNLDFFRSQGSRTATERRNIMTSDLRKRKIVAAQVLADIRLGMNNGLLKEKYSLSDTELAFVFKRLVQAGTLRREDIESRPILGRFRGETAGENSLTSPWQCPACHVPQKSEEEECPACGIVVAKFRTNKELDGPKKSSPANRAPHAESGELVRRKGISYGLLILAFLTVAIIVSTAVRKREPQTDRIQNASGNNQLAIKKRTVLQTSEIDLQPLTDLNFMAKDEVFRLRTKAVKRYPQLLSGDYQPSPAVFGEVADGLPWLGVLGLHLYGPGMRSIEGPSKHSLSILNPFLLVCPDFEFTWGRSANRQMDMPNSATPLYCLPRNLRWYPAIGKAEVTYDMECLMKHQVGVFDLHASNARDLNLKYLYVSYRDSVNVVQPTKPKAACEIPHFFHQGESCGYPGGCNNLSPSFPPLEDFQITGRPVKLVIYLWERKPPSVAAPPDMEYVIHLN